MKLFKWIFALALVGGASQALADGGECRSCDNCSDSTGINFCCEDSGFYLYGDVLYWEACKSDAVYDAGASEYRYLHADHDVGYRIGGVFHCDCKDIGIRWTSIELDEHKVDGSDRRYELDFEVLDIEFGYSLMLDCVDATLRPFVGVKCAWIDERFHYDGSDYAAIDMDAYGLYLGSSFSWPFYEACYCDTVYPISLVARAAWAILDADIQQTGTSDTWDKHCLFVNAYEAFIGVDFSLCICDCFELDVMIGYEVQGWLGMRQLDDNDDLSSLGLSGLTARFGASF